EVTSGVGASSMPADNIRHLYETGVVVGENIDLGQILTPGVHYEITDDAPPEITLLGDTPDGIYELEFEYVPWASRNDPTNGITNCVDVYVNGNRPTEATELAIFDTSKDFGGLYTPTNFLRSDG